jgi:hypothetical protein
MVWCRRARLRPAQKGGSARLGQGVDSPLDGDEPPIDVAAQDFGSLRYVRLKVPGTSRAFRQRGCASKRALPMRRHDRLPRPSTFNRIAQPAAMLSRSPARTISSAAPCRSDPARREATPPMTAMVCAVSASSAARPRSYPFDENAYRQRNLAERGSAASRTGDASPLAATNSRPASPQPSFSRPS